MNTSNTSLDALKSASNADTLTTSTISPCESLQAELNGLFKATQAEAGPILLRLLQSIAFKEYADKHGGFTAGMPEPIENLDESCSYASWPAPESSSSLAWGVVFQDNTIYGDELDVLMYMRGLEIVESLVGDDELEVEMEVETEEEVQTDDETDRWSVDAQSGSSGSECCFE